MRKLVKGDKAQLGSFSQPFEDANLIDAKPECLRFVPRPIRNLRLKEWQAVQIGTPRYFMIIALFDAKFVSLAQAKIYDRQTGEKHQIERQLPPWTFRNPRSLYNSSSRYSKRGFDIRFENDLENDLIVTHLHIRKRDDIPNIDAVFRLETSKNPPLIRSIPFEDGRSMYSHKIFAPVSGALKIQGEHVDLSKEQAFGFVDHHKGYYGRHMDWDWVTGGEFTDDGAVGFNLTRNDSINREAFNENAFWCDGELHALPAVNVIHNHAEKSWQVRDRDGRVNLVFHIDHDTHLNQNLGLVESRYRGPFGHFSGKLTSLDGTVLELERAFGMGEDFYLKA